MIHRERAIIDGWFDIWYSWQHKSSGPKPGTKLTKKKTKYQISCSEFGAMICLHSSSSATSSSDVNVSFGFAFSFFVPSKIHWTIKKQMHADNKWDSWKCWRNDKRKKKNMQKWINLLPFLFSLVGNWSTVVCCWIAWRFKTKEFMWIFNSIHFYLQPTGIYYYYYYLSSALHTADQSYGLRSCSKRNCTAQPRPRNIWKIINKLWRNAINISLSNVKMQSKFLVKIIDNDNRHRLSTVEWFTWMIMNKPYLANGLRSIFRSNGSTECG